MDRAALDVALTLGLGCGGWVPRGRLAEDGVIPLCYPNLQETASADPAERTARNVRDSDATLLIGRGALTGGSALTLQVARQMGRPVLHVDFQDATMEPAVQQVLAWLRKVRPAVLNVAGPRHSEDGGIYALAHELLERVFCDLRAADSIG